MLSDRIAQSSPDHPYARDVDLSAREQRLELLRPAHLCQLLRLAPQQQADRLGERLALHRLTLEELCAAALRDAGEGPLWTFETTEERWEHDLLQDLVAEMEELVEELRNH